MLLGETHWDGYTIFSVISGILLVLMALFPGEKAGTRVTYFVGGIIIWARTVSMWRPSPPERTSSPSISSSSPY